MKERRSCIDMPLTKQRIVIIIILPLALALGQLGLRNGAMQPEFGLQCRFVLRPVVYVDPGKLCLQLLAADMTVRQRRSEGGGRAGLAKRGEPRSCTIKDAFAYASRTS